MYMSQHKSEASRLSYAQQMSTKQNELSATFMHVFILKYCVITVHQATVCLMSHMWTGSIHTKLYTAALCQIWFESVFVM
jgi:hypothetical protein